MKDDGWGGLDECPHLRTSERRVDRIRVSFRVSSLPSADCTYLNVHGHVQINESRSGDLISHRGRSSLFGKWRAQPQSLGPLDKLGRSVSLHCGRGDARGWGRRGQDVVSRLLRKVVVKRAEGDRSGGGADGRWSGRERVQLSERRSFLHDTRPYR